MPRTKKPLQTAAPTISSPTTNGSAIQADVLTLVEAATYLRVAEAEVLRLVEEQALPARRVGKDWRFLKAAIQQWLSTASSTPELRKVAQLALAGKYKDDPDLIRICEDAYRQRGRSMCEDG